ncbi:MAG: dihydroorotate dehydrogenase PyrD [Desulfurococcaceae archaeon TW002]
MSGRDVDLSIVLAGVRLKHVLMNASGILGATPEHITRLASYGLAAIVTKTFTEKPREGYGPPIIFKLRNCGYINAVGLANPGIELLPQVVRRGKELELVTIVSVGGSSLEEFVKVSTVALDSGADMLELNLSCPHTRGYGLDIGSDPTNVYEVVKAVSSLSSTPVIAKLGLSDNYVKSSGKALEGGAKALTLINTVKAMVIDVYTAKPILTNVFGGMSGPPIHPIAVKIVYDVYKEYEPEIVGVGGIVDWISAAELILAGAKALQIGSALSTKPKELVDSVLKGLKEWVNELGYTRIKDLVGLAHKK